MSRTFKPHMDVLPPAQQRLWPELSKADDLGFVLYGGTAIALRLEDGVLQVASFDDLMATKVKVVLQRAEAKDYRDVATMISAGVSLSRGLAAARIIFGPNFQPSESLKALVYFGSGEGTAHRDTVKEKIIGPCPLIHVYQASAGFVPLPLSIAY